MDKKLKAGLIADASDEIAQAKKTLTVVLDAVYQQLHAAKHDQNALEGIAFILIAELQRMATAQERLYSFLREPHKTTEANHVEDPE